MANWGNRTIAPKEPERQVRDLSGFSPPLARLFGMICFSLFALGTTYLGGRLLGLNSDYWTSSNNWSLKAIGLVVVSFLLGFMGSVIGWGLAASIKVKSERSNYAISVLWHYLANGSLIWLPLFGLALTKFYGKEGVKQLVKETGEWHFGLYIVVLTSLTCLLIGAALLLTGLLKENTRLRLLPCMLVSAPFTLAMSYIQFNAFHIASRAWVFLGLLLSFALLLSSAYMIERDKFQRAQIQKK